jgi:hypothetical protein
MFKNFEIFWIKYGFEICVIFSIILIIIIGFLRRGKNGTWSERYYIPSPKYTKPVSKESKGEQECRRILRKIFNKPFNKTRPDFLRNPITGNFNMELDCYDDELKIAVEYNGRQHYDYIPFFHSSKEAFYNQKYRDLLKRDMCVKNNVKLIEVPYTVKIKDIENYLIYHLQK